VTPGWQWIWWQWRDETELAVQWSHVFCLGTSLSWEDEYDRRWRLDLTPYLATSPPDWPDWLLPGGPGWFLVPHVPQLRGVRPVTDT
jgi:hypothetical protein